MLKVLDSFVVVDENNQWRYYDGFGDVAKYVLRTGIATDDTTGDPSEFTLTPVEAGTGTSTVVNSATANSKLTVTTAANEYDGVNLQLKGEGFAFNAKKMYFGGKFTLSEATQTDFLFGLAETDTTLMATSSAHAIAVSGSGVFFAKLDGSTDIICYIYDGGAEVSSVTVGTMSTDEIQLEVYYDGSYIFVYVDGTKKAYVGTGLPSEALTLSYNYRAGSAAARTCEIADMKAIQGYS